MNEANIVEVKFKDDVMAKVREIISRYPEGKHKSALIPILHIAQAEFDGWLSVPVMDHVASILDIQPIEVYEVASFYSMYNLQPVGRCLLEVCRTSSCWMMGADDIIDYIGQRLGIKEGETTADGMFSLKAVECLGACGYAPMMQVGHEFHEFLTIEKTDELLDKFRRENKRSRYC